MHTEDLITLTKQHVGNRASSAISRDWYLDRVQDAYQDLTTFSVPTPNGGKRPLRFNELYGQRDTTLLATMDPNFQAWDSGTWTMLGLRDLDNDRDVRQKPLRMLLRDSPTDTGRVLRWSPYAIDNEPGYLLWKIPDEDLSVREFIYQRAETLTDADTSTPVIPVDWHEAIHIFAGHKAAHLLNLPDLGTTLAGVFLSHVQSKRLPREESQRQSRSIMIGTRGYTSSRG